jgi:hypothetical protein
MAATYWVNTAGTEQSVMDDTTMTVYSYQFVDDYNGNFYYFEYNLEDPANQLGLFPGGNNHFTWLNTHSQVFDSTNFVNFQDTVRSRFLNAKETRVGEREFFGSAEDNYKRETSNSKTFIGRGFAGDTRNVSQGAIILPEPSIGRFYTIYFQSVSGGQNPFAPDLQRTVDSQIRSGVFDAVTREVQKEQQAEVVLRFQERPYSTDTGGGKSYELLLAFGNKSAGEACERYRQDPMKYFGDTADLSECSVIAFDDKLSKYPEAGFYSDGTLSRYWDGFQFDNKFREFCFK